MNQNNQLKVSTVEMEKRDGWIELQIPGKI